MKKTFIYCKMRRYFTVNDQGAIAAEKMNVLYREILRMDRANDPGICTKIVVVENKHIDREVVVSYMKPCRASKWMPGFLLT